MQRTMWLLILCLRLPENDPIRRAWVPRLLRELARKNRRRRELAIAC